ncbi:MAG: PSD1 and planctomycete cytochrome C domain-containing protein [Isosphaerales bacterium]
MRGLVCSVAVWVTIGAPLICVDGGEPAPAVQAAREQFFEQNVRPLLAQNCYSCHGDKKQKGGLRLDSLESILKGGESGPAVVPGKPGESLLVEAINYQELEMPPTGKLSPEKVAVLTRWVSLGAPWPSRDRAAAHATLTTTSNPLKAKLTATDRAFWSFQPVRGSIAPDVAKPTAGAWADWSRNPIDHFILKALREHGLTPAPEADKPTLIRRATFDLTGLPPTPEEVDAFLADAAPEAYEHLVDRLLASPRYGQRWARHWLDLVRYAESDGFRQDAFRPQAWRYRDYVVRAFNSDKPYDRFLTEQLAGDELDPDDPELRVATGYLRLGTYEYNQRNVRGQWADMLNEITDVTGEVFLGLSIGCARCHDHKFDPILQKDYYRLQAFFTPLLPRDDLTMARQRQWAEYQSKRAAWEKAAAEVLRQIDAIEQPYRDQGTARAVAKFPEDIRAILRKPEQDRSLLERQLGTLASRQITFEHAQVPALLKGPVKAQWEALQKTLKRFDRLQPIPPESVPTASDIGPVSPPTLVPGDRKQAVIEPGFLSVFDPAPARIEPPAAAARSTGRRLALTHWLIRPDNPLSTRVIVNRVWQYHFGRGLVGTPSDFGRLGELPSHPKLLDWLAGEFVAQGWHVKPLHRLILTSASYRQAAVRNPRDLAAAQRVDPENRLLWKRTVQRLDAEEIRDAMLATSGELEPQIGGPSARTAQRRRTIDTRTIRNTIDTLLEAFDAPDGTLATPRRNTTTTATQALLMINGDWTLARAEALAARLERLEPASIDDRDRIVLAYRLAFGRQPEPEELEQTAAFLDRQARLPQPPSGRSNLAADQSALVDFCHVLFNSNEFLYVD